jgi:hypothetical protein
MTLPEKDPAKSAIISQLDAQEEIQKFVEAVSSYPAHFASNPKITFEEHLMRMSKDGEEAGSEQIAGD